MKHRRKIELGHHDHRLIGRVIILYKERDLGFGFLPTGAMGAIRSFDEGSVKVEWSVPARVFTDQGIMPTGNQAVVEGYGRKHHFQIAFTKDEGWVEGVLPQLILTLCSISRAELQHLVAAQYPNLVS